MNLMLLLINLLPAKTSVNQAVILSSQISVNNFINLCTSPEKCHEFGRFPDDAVALLLRH